MKKSLSAASAIFILAACARAPRPARAGSVNSKPDWIDSASMEYPREQYLTGVGMGDDRQTSEERAHGEIAKIFSSLVTVNETLTESETNSSGKNGSENKFAQDVSQTVQTISKKILEGVEIAEHWQDNATRQHYTLAVLGRAKAIVSVKEKIADFDKQAAGWEAELSSGTDKIAHIKAALRLLDILKARAEFNSELRVLDGSGQGLASPIDEAAVKAQCAQIFADLDVIVSIKGEKATEAETGVVKGLNDSGLQAKTGAGQSADIFVDGEIAGQIMQGDGTAWKFYRTTTTLSLKDGKNGKIFARFDLSDREASADPEEAARRSRVELSKKVAGTIKNAISAYFENY
jgi:hypothetical protein